MTMTVLTRSVLPLLLFLGSATGVSVQDIRAALDTFRTIAKPLAHWDALNPELALFGSSLQDLIGVKLLQGEEKNSSILYYFDFVPREDELLDEGGALDISQVQARLNEAFLAKMGLAVSSNDVGAPSVSSLCGAEDPASPLTITDYPYLVVLELCPSIQLERPTLVNSNALFKTLSEKDNGNSFDVAIEIESEEEEIPHNITGLVSATLQYKAIIEIPKENPTTVKVLFDSVSIGVRFDGLLDSDQPHPNVLYQDEVLSIQKSKFTGEAAFHVQYCGDGTNPCRESSKHSRKEADKDDLLQLCAPGATYTYPLQGFNEELCPQRDDDQFYNFIMSPAPTLHYVYQVKGATEQKSQQKSLGGMCGATASLTIEDSNVYDPNTPTVVTFNPNAVPWSEFQLPPPTIDPKVAIGVLRQMDTVLTQFKRNPLLSRHIPLTKTSFKKLLSRNGSLLKQRLVPTFLKPAPLECRDGRSFSSLSLRSRNMSATEEIKEEDKFNNVPLVFYFLEGELEAFPEDPFQVHHFMQQGHGERCNIHLDKSARDSVDKLAEQLRDKINEASCNVRACPLATCPLVRWDENTTSADADADTGEEEDDEDEVDEDEPFVDIEKCHTQDDEEECDVVVDVLRGASNTRVAFVASVAKDTDGNLRDIQLTGLYKRLSQEALDQGRLSGAANFTNMLHLPDQILGFPINRPDYPRLWPNFRDWKDLETKVEQTLRNISEVSDVRVAFQLNETDPNKLAISLEYQEKVSPFQVELDTSAGIGSLIDIQKMDDSMMEAEATNWYRANFDVAMGTLVKEPIRMLVEPHCTGPSLESAQKCFLKSAQFLLRYQRANANATVEEELRLFDNNNGTDNVILPYESREELVTSVVAELSRSLNELSSKLNETIAEVLYNISDNTNLAVLQFAPDVTHAEILVRKFCNPITAWLASVTPDVLVPDESLAKFECDDDVENEQKRLPLEINRAYGIPIDQIADKAKFELSVGKVTVSSNVKVSGESQSLKGSVAGFLETVVELDTSIVGDLSLHMGSNDNMLDFPDWIADVRSVLQQPEPDEPDDVFEVHASSTFDGNFSATVGPDDPVHSVYPGNFSRPFQLNFSSKPPFSRPDIEMDFDFEDIGDVTKMNAIDVVKVLLYAMDFLVGPDPNDSVQTCSGGLLGMSEIVPGKNVFAYQLPVLAITPCKSVQVLQGLTAAVQLLGEVYGLVDDDNAGFALNATSEALQNATGITSSDPPNKPRLSKNTTLQALENMLQTLLEDRFEGQSVNVTLNTTSNELYSDLFFDISIITAPAKQQARLTLDLKELLHGQPSVVTEIANFVHELTPPYAVQADSDFHFNLGIGLEYDRVAEEIRPYIQGNTGLEASWHLDGKASLERTAIGPFTGSLDVKFCLGNTSEPLALAVSLDPTLNYYIEDLFDDEVPTTTDRPGFLKLDMAGFLDQLEPMFSGAVTIDLEMGLPEMIPGLPAATTNVSITIEDLSEFLRNPSDGIEVTFVTNTPNIPRFSLFELLLLDPGALVEQLDDALQNVEDAALGRHGVVTTFPVPFLRNGISSALGGNTKNNILAKSRRLIVESFTDALGIQQGGAGGADNFIVLIADSLDKALRAAGGLIHPGEEVSFQCFRRNGDNDANGGNSTVQHINTPNCADDASSVVWNVPLGQKIQMPVPLDFSLDRRLPFHISLGGDNGEDSTNQAVLSLAWSFNFSFGFDETDGFFVYTGEADEFKIEALMDAAVEQFEASLFFLSADVIDLDLVFGAGFFIDMDKAGMLRSLEGDEPRGSPDRVTIGDLGRAVSPADLFHVEARAGATLCTGNITLGLTSIQGLDESVAKWIPSLQLSLASQFRKISTNAGQSARHIRRRRRSLLGRPVKFAALGQLHELHGIAEHRAMGLLRSLSLLGDDMESPYPIRHLSSIDAVDILEKDFEFEPCRVNLQKENACLRVHQITLLAEPIQELVKSIADKFVNDGILGTIIEPLTHLDKRIPGISDLISQDVTVLDIAETLAQGSRSAKKAKKGVQSVRKVIRMFNDLKALAKDGLDQDGNEVLAETCDVLNNFTCWGGLSGGNDLALATARTNNFNNLKMPDVEGLEFPFLKDPLSLLGLVQGEDVALVDFTPPEFSFFFELEMPVVLWTPPTITAFLEFSFEIELKTGFVLDSKGIREAIEQKAPEKAANSIAIKDTFDGVDEPILSLEGRVGASLDLNIGISVRVGGGLIVQGTIDLYDPNPSTSGGLVRPYEIFAGGNADPSNWLEAGVAISVDVRFSVSLGIFPLFKFVKKLEIVSFDFEPNPREPCAKQNLMTGVLELELDSYSNFQCTSLSGTGGQEEIECKCGGSSPVFKTIDGIRSLSGEKSANKLSNLQLQGVHSSSDISVAIGTLVLDYRSSGDTILAENFVAVSGSKVLVGESFLRFDAIESGQIILPQPEMALLRTVVGGDCSNKWELQGHTDLWVNVAELKQGCEIESTGGNNTDAKLVIDFGSQAGAECFDGNEVRFQKDRITIVRQDAENLAKPSPFNVTVGPAFKHLEIIMTDCKDTFEVKKLHPNIKSLSVELFGGDDSFAVGGANGLDKISGTLILNGGSGRDDIRVDDAGSLNGKNGTLTPASLLGMLEKNNTLDYVGFEVIAVNLSAGENRFLVTSTPLDSFTSISGGRSSDFFEVLASQGDLELFGGDGSDHFSVYGLGGDTTCTIYGEEGADVLLVDGTNALFDEPYNISNATGAELNATPLVLTNALDQSIIRWSGGSGSDRTHVQFVAFGNMTLDLFDDLEGSNALTADCSDYFACELIFRENFISNFHAMNASSSPNFTGIPSERINIARSGDEGTKSGYNATAGVSNILLRLNSGSNKVWFDDTFCTIDLFGGTDRDEFRFGQLYESPDAYFLTNYSEINSTNATVAPDTIKAIPTSAGFLSAGNSHTVSVFGRSGNNFFDFRRNHAPVYVHSDSGETGNNEYVVRSSLVAVAGEELKYRTFLETTSNDFTVNAPVHLIGGLGADQLKVVGTEARDDYVITKDEVRGGGLSIRHTSMNTVDVLGQDGDDQVTVLSTESGTITQLFGGDGFNSFVITPRLVDPIVSKNLRGHQGIVEHFVSTSDDEYARIVTEGVAVNVLDVDGAFGYIFVEDIGMQIVSEDGGRFNFSVCPTRPPEGIVVVDVASQTDLAGTPYLTLNDAGPLLQLKFDGTVCQIVDVEYNTNSVPLENTAITLLIRMDVNSLFTDDLRFQQTEQHINPVVVELIPALGTEKAMSVTVVESNMETVVSEGAYGLNATYDIYLRPCSEEMRNNTVLTIKPDCPGQVFVQLPGQNSTLTDEWNITGDEWQPEENCRVAVNVSAVDDGVEEERIHFTRLRHMVTDVNDTTKLLSDGSFLLAKDVFVRIFDQESAGLITQQSLGWLDTAEIDVKSKGFRPGFLDLLEDVYHLRLSKQPESDVNITVESFPAASNYFANSTSSLDQRAFAKRSQVSLQKENKTASSMSKSDRFATTSSENVTLVFTPENWHEWQPVRVAAQNDKITEGFDYYSFPTLFEPTRGKGKAGKAGMSRNLRDGYCSNNGNWNGMKRKLTRGAGSAKQKKDHSEAWRKTSHWSRRAQKRDGTTVPKRENLRRGSLPRGKVQERRNLRQKQSSPEGTKSARTWEKRGKAMDSTREEVPNGRTVNSSNRQATLTMKARALDGYWFDVQPDIGWTDPLDDTLTRPSDDVDWRNTVAGNSTRPSDDVDWSHTLNSSYPFDGNSSDPLDGNWSDLFFGNWSEHGHRPKRNLDGNPLLGGEVAIEENEDGEVPGGEDAFLAPGTLYFG